MSYKPNLAASMPAAAANAGGSAHPTPSSMAAPAQYRQMLSDYGPPSLGYTQEKQARARERDRLKKRRRREDGCKRGLERSRNALAMRRRRWEGRRENWEARRLRQRLEASQEQDQGCQERETTQQRRLKRREEQGSGSSQAPQSKYAELLAIIEELGKEIRPTYAGSKSAMERLKRGIIHARGLVRECLAETERNARS